MQLGEALALGNQLPPSVLNSLPTVFTASLDGTLQVRQSRLDACVRLFVNCSNWSPQWRLASVAVQ